MTLVHLPPAIASPPPATCAQLAPGIESRVMFVEPDGRPRTPAPGEIAALLDEVRAAHDYEWLFSTDKTTGAELATLVDHRHPDKRPGEVVAVIPITGGGAKALSDIVLVSLDGSGEGVNDTTARSPVGGNTGTTLGAQRLNAMTDAATFWADKITSSVDIRVEVDWEDLTCGATSTVLGQAGPLTVVRDSTNLPLSNTWYVIALANKFAGSDLATSSNDIGASFNSALDGSCAFPLDWYYGLDGNFGSDIDFRDTFLHELGHGLGFLTLVNLTSGLRFGSPARDDLFMTFLRDETEGADWPSLTNNQRKNSAINTGNLTWNGSNVAAYITANPTYLTTSTGLHSTSNRVRLYAPDPVESGSSVSHWDEALDPDELMEPIADPNTDSVLTQNAFLDMGWTGSLPVALDQFEVR